MAIPEAVRPYVRQTWKPLVIEADGPLTASKFSGQPFLKPGESWPCCQNCGQPMQLFVQLNLDTLPEVLQGEYGHGLLQMFYCVNEQTECEIACEAWWPFARSHYPRLVAPSDSGVTVATPTESAFFSPKLIVDWAERNDYPSWGELDEYGVQLSDEAAQSLFDQGFPVSGDKLAGWPDWVQNVEYPNCPICYEKCAWFSKSIQTTICLLCLGMLVVDILPSVKLIRNS
ncbi:MAG: DUF1963 domain-containing protein [Caldilineaceae bacterium]